MNWWPAGSYRKHGPGVSGLEFVASSTTPAVPAVWVHERVAWQLSASVWARVPAVAAGQVGAGLKPGLDLGQGRATDGLGQVSPAAAKASADTAAAVPASAMAS